MQYPHLEALHDIANVPYEEALGPRVNKENILEQHGFSKGTNPAEVVIFEANSDHPPDVQAYLSDKIAEGKYTALLFRDGRWESMGGCPVIYAMNETSIKEALTFGPEGQVMQVQSDEELFVPGPNTRLNTYTRKHSIQATLEGFDNYEEPLDVALGGGFRLQIDGLTHEEGRPSLTMSAHFSFNDYGSRVLAKANEKDTQVPMASKSFRVPIVDGKLDLPIKDIDLGKVATAEDAMTLVLSELFQKDGPAIGSLTRDLMTVRPVLQIHQFEGIYGVTEENGVSAEVIDFDGLDAFDLTAHAATAGPVERLVGGQLMQAGYLPAVDQGARVVYYQQQEGLRSSLERVSGAEDVSEAVKRMTSMHPGEDVAAYANRLNAYGRLARSIGYCSLDWTITSAPNVKQAHIDDWTITQVEAGGFEAAFIERDGQLVPLEDTTKDIYDAAKQVLGSNMLRLYVSQSREGD